QAGGHDHHRKIDPAGDGHRDDDIDLLEAKNLTPLLRVATDDASLGQRRVEVDDVGHHRGADDPGGEQDALGAVEARSEQVLDDLASIRIRVEDLEREGNHDDADHPDDDGLETPEASLL